ncbi:MAG: DNA-3-methyladenine glycosylase [Planctomycetaceae bacterium]|jgi:DNA-3-methyladenine glycosylase|nr:DNA-3-methyladenine glycosylase [Planctomycetaceae bacterium]
MSEKKRSQQDSARQSLAISNVPLSREFYLRDAVTVARALLGKRLVCRIPIRRMALIKQEMAEKTTSGIIVETEAYAGWDDEACHSYKRKQPSPKHRTNIMFAEGGLVYVYLIYGMYNCFNVVANVPGNPEAVLIRAIEPREGIDVMQQRRQTRSEQKIKNKHLCSGPGKLCMAMGVTRDDYGKDLCGDEIFITEGIEVAPNEIAVTPRINVDYAGDSAKLPYRFAIRDNPCLSTRKFIDPCKGNKSI